MCCSPDPEQWSDCFFLSSRFLINKFVVKCIIEKRGIMVGYQGWAPYFKNPSYVASFLVNVCVYVLCVCVIAAWRLCSPHSGGGIQGRWLHSIWGVLDTCMRDLQIYDDNKLCIHAAVASTPPSLFVLMVKYNKQKNNNPKTYHFYQNN